MAGYGAFQFSSPSEYSDWAKYAGFDRRTGEMQSPSMPSGVKPPENMQEYLSQRMSAASDKLAAVAPAMQQATAGNLFQAAQTLRNAKPSLSMQPSQSTQVPTFDTGYDYTFGL